ncbi:MAG: 3-oxoacyl-[acyl-carrier-protein] synthase III C-terminal domain-containing protein [Bacteroidota bacterium]
MGVAKIIGLAKALPGYCRTTADIIPFVEIWLGDEEVRFRRKVVKIFEGAGVDKRYGIMPIEAVFTQTSFEAKNDLYSKAAISLGKTALQKALHKADWAPKSLDFIITVSCTGIMIPSLDAYLVNLLGLRQDIIRMPVTEMGCAAGVSGIIYAANFLRANPNKRAAVIAVESPTATFQHSDKTMANMVSAAIFGDGASCVLLSSKQSDNGPKVVGEGMYHFYDAITMMGFDLTDSGLKMVLDPKVPEVIAAHFPKFTYPFLENLGTSMERVSHLIFHPGGKKIVQTVDTLFGQLGKNIDLTRKILKDYGNMSSATVLYVLEAFMEKEIAEGEQGLILSFGPGFSAQRVLIEW